MLELRIAFKSDSEIILNAYEKNNNIKVTDLLNLPVEDGAKRGIQRFIDSNEDLDILTFMNKYNIFDYPHFMPIATSTSKKELEEVFDTLKVFRNMVLKGYIDLSDSKYNFMTNKRETRKKKENRPGCFDGLCLEKNIEKMFPFAREAY